MDNPASKTSRDGSNKSIFSDDTTPESRAQEEGNRIAKDGVRWSKVNAMFAALGALTTITGIVVTAMVSSSSPTPSETSPQAPDIPTSTESRHDTGEASAHNGDTASSHSQTTSLTGLVTGCYNDGTLTPCSSLHTKEVIAESSDTLRDQPSLVSYMGGKPGIDLPLSSMTITTIGASTVVEFPFAIDRPLKGIWDPSSSQDGYPTGGELRRCFNSQEREESCNSPHVSEEFYAGTTDTSCEAKFSEIRGKPLGNDISFTEIESFQPNPSDGLFHCRIKVKRPANDQLTRSIWNLGTTALPKQSK